MTPVQIYQIINNIAGQALGLTDLTPTDTTFISIGKQVLSTTENVDAMYKTLVDRIGRTVLAVREYKAKMPSMAREPFEYGAILQKISFKMAQAQSSDTWTPNDTKAADPWEKAHTTFMQVFFDKWTAWEFQSTIYDVQLETAFLNAGAMMAFIDGIFQSMYNALELAYENIGNLARASLIGSIINQGDGTASKVNLIALYQTETGNTVTVQSALTDVNFLKFASMKMALASDQMVKMSTTFNIKKWERHTPKDRQVFEIQSNFAKAFDSYLQSDTFHNELTKLPNYESVPYWQGSGETWELSDVTGINVSLEVAGEDNTMSTVTVEQTNIIGVLRDIDSCGITIDKRRTKSIYNPRGEYTNYWLKAELGQFRDVSENCIVFYLEDVEAQASLNEITA